MRNFIIDFIFGLLMMIFGIALGNYSAQPSKEKLKVQAKMRCQESAFDITLGAKLMLDYQDDNNLLIPADYGSSMDFMDILNKTALEKCEAMNEQR